MKTQKIAIACDEEGFIMAKKKVEKKRELFIEMLNEARAFIPVPNTELKQFRAEPLKYFERELMLIYENMNVMKLSFKKLTDLLDLDIQKFMDAVARYEAIKLDETQDVDREQFVTYATTKEQIEKYNTINAFCDYINNLKATICPNLGLAQVQTAFMGALLIDTSFSKLRPNPAFILG